MTARFVPAVVASVVFGAGVGTSGVLAKASLGVCVMAFVIVALAAVMWVIGAPWLRVEWVIAGALVSATPINVVTHERTFDVHVSVVPLADLVLVVAGVTDGLRFAYEDAYAFPDGSGWTAPDWPWAQVVLIALVLGAIAHARRPGAPSRLSRLVLRGRATSAGHP